MDINRRDFLKAAGVAAAGVAGAGALLKPSPAKASNALQLLEYEVLVPEIFQSQPTVPSSVDALIIGSGFGAAVTGLRLAQAGIKTAMLERGSRWPMSLTRNIFAADWLPDGRGYWHRTSATTLVGLKYYFDDFGGIFDVTPVGGVDVWRAAIVGGGSKVYTGVWIQPPKAYYNEIFGKVCSASDLTWDAMQTWYAKSLAGMTTKYGPNPNSALGVSTMPSDIYASTPWTHARQWDRAAAKMGYNTSSTVSSVGLGGADNAAQPWGLLGGNWNWDTVRKENAGTSRASVTDSLSNLGNSNGVKVDLTQNYIPAAEATGNLTVYPGHQVISISQVTSGTNKGKYTVSYLKLDPNGNVLVSSTVTAKYLFLCAGSIGTTELLMRSQALGGLSNLQNVGTLWGDNGDSADVATFATTPFVEQGASSHSWLLDATTNPDMPVRLENWYVPGLPTSATVLGCLGMAYDRSGGSSGTFNYNKAKDPLLVSSHGYSGTGLSLTSSWDTNSGITAATRAVHNKMVAAGGGIAGAEPFNTDIVSTFTAHPLGGAVIGQTTDAYGRVTGHPNLYVNDAALIPGTTGTANPVWTIAALAERNIANIIKNDNLT